MTRRELLCAAAVGGLGRSLRGADLKFPGAGYREYSRCLPDYLRGLAAAAYDRRNREIQKLTSAASIRERQKWVERTFWELTGGKPAPSPLHVQEIGGFDRPGYRLTKLVYQSQPEIYVPANLYVPTTGAPPYPGVLFQMGHSPNGKEYDSYQRCCQGLARLGYVVLAFDPMGQGERIYYPDSTGIQTRLRSSDDEHTVPGRQMLLIGETATRMQVWDAVRSLDVLAAHPKVDRARLASTGQSGGATITMLLLAIDDRLAAAAECSGNTENLACASFNPPGSTDDAEQNFVNSGPVGFDRWDLFYPFAPKPLLITVSDKDSFGTYSPSYIGNGWEEFGKLKHVYEVFGKGDNLMWSDTPLPHGLSYDSRLQVYNWFERHLKGSGKRIEEEPEVSPEPDRDLWAAKTGNVVSTFGGQTPFTLTKSRQVAKTAMPLEKIVGSDRPPSGLRAATLSRVPSRGIWIEALDVPSAQDVSLPAWLFLPRTTGAGKPLLVMLNAGGRNAYWHEEEVYQRLARAGYAVCAADVRGIGDLTPEFGRGAAAYEGSHHSEENSAWASMMLGKPLLGQRVTDILALVAALRAHPGVAGRRTVLNANGKMTVPAAIAAALDNSVDSIYLSGGLVSYRSVLETERYTEPFANFCMGILQHTDLPEIVASIGPRKITLAGAVDGAGKRVDATSMRQMYGGAHVTVRPDEDWTFADLT